MTLLAACQTKEKQTSQPTVGLMEVLPRDTSMLRMAGDSLEARAIALNGDSSLYFLEQSLRYHEGLPPDLKKVRILLALADQYYQANRFESANRNYESARTTAKEIGAPAQLQITLLISLARTKVELLDFVTAMSMANHALDLVRKNFPDNNELLAKCYRLFSSVHYYKREFDTSIEYNRKAIQCYKNAGIHQELEGRYFTIALTYVAQEKYPIALENLDLAIASHHRWPGADSIILTSCYLNKGAIFRKMGLNDSALNYYARTLRMRRRIYGEKNVNTFGIRYEIASTYREITNYDSALVYFQRCLQSLIRQFDDPDWHANPVPRSFEINTDLFLGLTGKASTLWQMATRDGFEPERAANALATFQLADSVLTVIRRHAAFDDPKMVLKETYRSPYEAMAEICFELFRHTPRDIYLEKALWVLERSRATVLQDVLMGAAMYNQGELSGDFFIKENQLASERAALILRMTTAQPGEVDSLDRILIRMDQERQANLTKLQASYPNYFSARYADLSLSLKGLRDFAEKRNAAFLEYLWGERNIFLLIVQRGGATLQKIPRTETFSSDFIQFRQAVHTDENPIYSREEFDRFTSSAFSLYQILIGDHVPMTEGRKRLVISADGPLATFPFEALISRNSGGKDIDYHLPYLLYDFDLSYEYSANLFKLSTSRQRQGRKLIAMGYGGDGAAPQKRNGFQDLPGTGEEIAAIRMVMKNESNAYLLAERASETAFKNKVSGFNVAHLAVHGVGDTITSLRSRLIFRSDEDSLEDGNLYAHEVYGLDLKKLDLAVLSACESGVGKEQTGEGAMSIARGFAYAGCPSLVISLWRLEDLPSAKIMAGFYQALSDGLPVDESLSRAKINYLSNVNEFNSHPSYWAAFLAVGDMDALKMEKPNAFGWVLIAVLMVGTFSWLLSSYRRRGPQGR